MELVKIIEGKQAVNARDLHQFIESKKDFSNWIKHRIEKYGLVENQDFTVFNQLGENPKGGRPIKEYALTIEAAKELAMVEGNEKGKQARQYFIECERKLKETSTPALSTLDILELSIKQIREQDKRIMHVESGVLEVKSKVSEVESKVDLVLRTQQQAQKQLMAINRSEDFVPEETLRNKIRRLINEYVRANRADYRAIWSLIYDRLYYRYHVNLRAVRKYKNESALEAAERLGHLPKIYAIVSHEIV